jgi:DNA-binding MarR family transcriptional regulator
MSSDPRWADDLRDHSRDNLQREQLERDPRDAFVRHIDLPRGPEREIVRDRDRDYTLRGSETRTLATVGAFRVVPTGQLRDHDNAAARDRSADVRHLREQGLIETVRVPGHRGSVMVLTKEGRDLLERHRDDQGDASQTFYAGLKRTRELEHDAQIFTAYLEAAERLHDRGARVDRVVLDYELKRDYQKWLHEHDGDREATTATTIGPTKRFAPGLPNTTFHTSMTRCISRISESNTRSLTGGAGMKTWRFLRSTTAVRMPPLPRDPDSAATARAQREPVVAHPIQTWLRSCCDDVRGTHQGRRELWLH